MSFFQKVLKTKSQENVALDLGRGALLGGDKAIDTEMENLHLWQRCVFALFNPGCIFFGSLLNVK